MADREQVRKWGVRVRLIAGRYVVEQLSSYKRQRAKVVSTHATEKEAELAAREWVQYLILHPPPPPEKRQRFVLAKLF